MNSFEDGFRLWLRRKQTALDAACSKAIKDGLQGLDATNLNAANESLSKLYASDSGFGYGPGSDCDYSLKGVGSLYTGHWHGKRVHDSLAFLVALRSAFSMKPVHVLDIGAGTGAVLWAWTLLATFSREIGNPMPVHSWTSLDSSSEMLAQNKRLWERLCQVLPNANRVVARALTLCGDWRNHPTLPSNGTIIGSFLFSRHDLSNPVETSKIFADFVSKSAASVVMLSTRPNKRAVLDRLKTRLAGWTETEAPALFTSSLKGELRACQIAVKEAFARHTVACEAKTLGKFHWGGAASNACLLWMVREQDSSGARGNPATP
jgi:hypothetical protein